MQNALSYHWCYRSCVVVELLILVMQVFLLQPDGVKVLICLSLHFLPDCLISMVLSHFLIGISPVLFVSNLFRFLGEVLLVVHLYLQS
jgi:hypothetical protein